MRRGGRGGRGRRDYYQGGDSSSPGASRKIESAISIIYNIFDAIDELKKAEAPVELKLVHAPSLTKEEIAKTYSIPVR